MAVQPPTIVLFCSDPKAISPQYQRYLLRVFRDELNLGEVPVKLYLRQREHGDSRDEIEAKRKDDPFRPLAGRLALIRATIYRAELFFHACEPSILEE